ncbi:MAG TPA: translation initiation factor IF-5A [Candidatus Nanoarchaeia archaeon]|nr:translation initiation factor IF-5A [Candidatus Nanoarchaeia archaeon]
MDTKMISANQIQKGSFVILEGVPSKVTDVEISRPGKHGHSKVRLSAVGLMDDRKRIVVMPGHDNVDVPIIEKKTAQVLTVQGNKANVMDAETYETFDMAIPDELKDSVAEGVSVLYWTIMDTKVMKQIKGSD